jgi:hypothetical protein
MLQWIWPVPLFLAALAGPESKQTPGQTMEPVLMGKVPGGSYAKVELRTPRSS